MYTNSELRQQYSQGLPCAQEFCSLHLPPRQTVETPDTESSAEMIPSTSQAEQVMVHHRQFDQNPQLCHSHLCNYEIMSVSH